jgi:hypothetical protein
MLPSIRAVTLVVFISVMAAAQTSIPIPTIDLIYPAPNGTIFDTYCGELLKTTVSRAAVEETMRRRPELQALWDREGQAYLSTTFSEIGLPFPYKEMQAYLTVCPGVIPMAAPLFMNVSRYLSSAATRYPDAHFVETLYHELMHTYIHPVVATSALRKKYASEPRAVVSHLHVMALEKMVLLKMGKEDELKRVASEYQSVLPPEYRRAWEIVDKIEGYQPMVNELKQLTGSGR